MVIMKLSTTLVSAILFCAVTTILFASNVYPIYLTWHVWRDIDVSTDKDEKEILFWSLIIRLAKKYIGIKKYPEILLYLNLLYYYI